MDMLIDTPSVAPASEVSADKVSKNAKVELKGGVFNKKAESDDRVLPSDQNPLKDRVNSAFDEYRRQKEAGITKHPGAVRELLHKLVKTTHTERVVKALKSKAAARLLANAIMASDDAAILGKDVLDAFMHAPQAHVAEENQPFIQPKEAEGVEVHIAVSNQAAVSGPPGSERSTKNFPKEPFIFPREAGNTDADSGLNNQPKIAAVDEPLLKK